MLLGLDCNLGAGGQAHWHGNHTGRLTNPNEATLNTWRGKFTTLAADLQKDGAPVYNCSRQTTLDCFPRHSLEEVAQLLHG